VISVIKTERVARTFNLEVGDFHSYFVGSAGLWVHNSCDLGARKIVSRIKESSKLVRGAEAAGRSVQQSIDNLTEQLARGNLNPGIGTKPIGKGISEARARDGARVYFRAGPDGTIEILGKSTKANQQSVIDEVLRVFGN
jgi:putative component of toxin-antitoxin plasmid stabilization module